MQPTAKLFPGDLVEVRTPDEILETLDLDGALDCLPFMPEMVELCGSRFPVSRRVVKTCTSGSGASTMRGFRTDDVVLLDGLRCCGTEHDGCQKACAIFWREAWLRRVEASEPQAIMDQEGRRRLRGRLKTLSNPTTYFVRRASCWTRPNPCRGGNE